MTNVLHRDANAMTNFGTPTKPNTTDSVPETNENTVAVSVESGEAYMRTLGKVLYDIIQDWQQAQNNTRLSDSRETKIQPLNVREGRQI